MPSAEELLQGLAKVAFLIPGLEIVQAEEKLRECCEQSLTLLEGTNNPDARLFLTGLGEFGLHLQESKAHISVIAGALDRYMSSLS
jgi:hypothetical protein